MTGELCTCGHAWEVHAPIGRGGCASIQCACLGFARGLPSAVAATLTAADLAIIVTTLAQTLELGWDGWRYTAKARTEVMRQVEAIMQDCKLDIVITPVQR